MYTRSTRSAFVATRHLKPRTSSLPFLAVQSLRLCVFIAAHDIQLRHVRATTDGTLLVVEQYASTPFYGPTVEMPATISSAKRWLGY